MNVAFLQKPGHRKNFPDVPLGLPYVSANVVTCYYLGRPIPASVSHFSHSRQGSGRFEQFMHFSERVQQNLENDK